MIQFACAACGHAGDVPEIEGTQSEPFQCPMCGTWIRSYAAEVEAASQPPPEPDEDDLERPIGYLVLAGILETQEPFPVHGPKAVVGRENADITIDDPTMSSHHFEIEERDGEIFIRDLDSTNTTRVNGQAISATTLKSGDRILAGLTAFVFRTS